MDIITLIKELVTGLLNAEEEFLKHLDAFPKAVGVKILSVEKNKKSIGSLRYNDFNQKKIKTERSTNTHGYYNTD